MPFGLSSSRSSTKSSTKSNLSEMESGRMNMSGIFHDGQKNKSSSKSRNSPNRNSGRQQYQYKHQQMEQNNHGQQQMQHIQQEYQQNSNMLTPPRSKTPSGRSSSSQRSRSNNRYPPSQSQQQHEMQSQSYLSVHDHGVISQSYSNHSLGSRHSSHSKHSNTSAGGQKRHHHQHRRTGSNNSNSAHSPSSSNTSSRYHHQQHNRVPSSSSELGSVHSHPTVTSRSTISDPSGHSHNSSYHNHPSTQNDSRRINTNHQYNVTEHRDPHGETTNTRRAQHQRQVVDHHSTINTPQRHHHHNGSHSSPSPYGFSMSFPSSPIIKPTPMKNGSGASIGSIHSRGSMSYNSVVPNSGKSTISATTSVVSKDKHAIKSTKKVIEELKKSTVISYPAEKRVIALTNACAEFDHLDDSKHNMELQQGAAVVLCKVLALILNSADAVDHDYGIGRDYEFNPAPSDTNGNDDGNKSKENAGKNAKTNISTNIEENDNYDDALRMIASALEMVFRGQSVFVHSAYDKCGGNTSYEQANSGPSPKGLLPLLLRLLDRAEGLSNNHQMKPHNAEVTLVNATKVLLYLSRVPELRIHLARQPNLLDALGRVANKDMGTMETNNNSLSAEARVARVRIITNLVNEEENKILMLAHRSSKATATDSTEGGVLDALLRVAHTDPNERAREYAGAALMDMASAPSNQIPMTKNEQLLGTLIKMIFIEKNPATRESAITALQNLAFTKENRIRLVSFKSGVILEALIQALSNTRKDFNEKSRRRSAGALTNLSCDESAGLMGRHKGLLQTLAIVSTKDESPEVQTRSAMALTKLAASITIRMDAPTNGVSGSQDGAKDSVSVHSNLLDALVVASLSSVPNSVSAVLRVKARDPENRYLMASHPGILDTLADMCLSDNGGETDTKTSYTIDIIKDRDNATRALMHLTNESKNRSIMCTSPVLNALVRGASLMDEEIQKHSKQKQLQDVRDSAIRAIERLATEFSNRHKMAHHDGMIVAIASATAREAKLETGLTNTKVVIDEQPGLFNGAGTRTATNDSVECSSYTSALTPPRPRNQNQLPDPQHSYLAKPLLMSLLVAM